MFYVLQSHYQFLNLISGIMLIKDSLNISRSLDWIPWSSCSPDLTPVDLFLWGYVKDILYWTSIQDINDLKQKITDAIATVDDATLERTWQEIEHHLDVLLATNGAHREVY